MSFVVFSKLEHVGCRVRVPVCWRSVQASASAVRPRCRAERGRSKRTYLYRGRSVADGLGASLPARISSCLPVFVGCFVLVPLSRRARAGAPRHYGGLRQRRHQVHGVAAR